MPADSKKSLDLSIEQIAAKLSERFQDDGSGDRKIIFWYDNDGSFAGDIDTLAGLLTHAKINRLDGKNQMKTKYLLETEDPTSNYLVYAPFPCPPVADNHLEDTMLYSESFEADRISILMQEFEIPSELRIDMEDHAAFWQSAERRRAFAALSISPYTRGSLLTGMLCVLVKVKTLSFTELMREVLSGNLEKSPLLESFRKFNLLDFFWERVRNQFGYEEETPTLTELVVSLFATYASRDVGGKFSEPFAKYIHAVKAGNVMAFLDDLMNHEKYSVLFDTLSGLSFKRLSLIKNPSSFPVDAWASSHVFSYADERILSWMEERLLSEDLNAKLGDMNLPTLARQRAKTHFGKKKAVRYAMLSHAYGVIAAAHFTPENSLEDLVKRYTEQHYKVDRDYRGFYLCYDEIPASEKPEELRVLVENIYTKNFLGVLLPRWNHCLTEQGNFSPLPLQQNFFHDNLSGEKEKTMVIISDALRYEVGREIFEELSMDPKADVSMKYMVSTLPSFTRLGMSALLPHDTLTIAGQGKNLQILTDGIHAIDLAFRRRVFTAHVPDGDCFLFSDLVKEDKNGLRQAFNGKRIIYVYHDTIDTTGEHNEDDVFHACEKAVWEIITFMRRVSGSGNLHRFMLTSDHGFLYKRDGFAEWQKIGGVSSNDAWVKRRYILADHAVQDDGVCSLPEKSLLGKQETKTVSFPLSLNVFKASGGLAYVHGGSSPQELLIPLLKVKFQRSHVDTNKAALELISSTRTITNTYVSLDFLQSSPVSAEVKSAHVIVYFQSDTHEKLSNENVVVLDKKGINPSDRMLRLSFHFKDKKYDAGTVYYLSIDDADTGEALVREPFHIEISSKL